MPGTSPPRAAGTRAGSRRPPAPRAGRRRQGARTRNRVRRRDDRVPGAATLNVASVDAPGRRRWRRERHLERGVAKIPMARRLGIEAAVARGAQDGGSVTSESTASSSRVSERCRRKRSGHVAPDRLRQRTTVAATFELGRAARVLSSSAGHGVPSSASSKIAWAGRPRGADVAHDDPLGSRWSDRWNHSRCGRPGRRRRLERRPSRCRT